MQLAEEGSLWLSAVPLELWQHTAAVPAAAADAAADAAGCLVTVSMEPAPIVMVMGQGKETQQWGKGDRDTSTSAVCIMIMKMNCDIIKDDDDCGGGDTWYVGIVSCGDNLDGEEDVMKSWIFILQRENTLFLIFLLEYDQKCYFGLLLQRKQ